MKRILILFLLPILLSAACSFSSPSPAAPLAPTETVAVPPTSPPAEAPPAAAPTAAPVNVNDYAIFSINMQDFSYPEKSAAVLERIITLHEIYKVPVDIYLTDVMAQIYAEQFPQLLERLKTSPVVAISYHYRPPRPYANNYDWLGLRNMRADELYQTILRYETHAVDPVTGQTTEAAGGYQYVASLIGYPPYAASSISDNAEIDTAILRVFKELGAQMAGRLTVEMSDRLAAGAGNESPLAVPGPSARPISFLLTYGNEDDNFVRYNNGAPYLLDESLIQLPQVKTLLVERWLSALQLADVYEYSEGTLFGERYVRFTYAGAENRFELLFIDNLDHNYPNGKNHAVVAADVTWEFFQQYQLP
ncbi:MAG: hypothetical protein Kow0070_23990 [Anaerolineales bacterium]